MLYMYILSVINNPLSANARNKFVTLEQFFSPGFNKVIIASNVNFNVLNTGISGVELILNRYSYSIII